MKSSLELGNDIQHFKSFIGKCRDKYIGNNVNNEDNEASIMDFHDRVDFVVFQIKDIFNNNY